MVHPVPDRDIPREAAQVTLGYAGAFFFNIAMQVYGKVTDLRQFQMAKAAGTIKTKYNRYASDGMLAADRSVGNFVEWQGTFLALFWTNAVVAGGKELWLGWVYVVVRMLYPILAQRGALKKHGVTPLIFVATVPGYYVLLRYMYLIYRGLSTVPKAIKPDSGDVDEER
ncbi:hypothetical protein H310_07396 [Aphanomyces invadans]|uniref:Uncharacterized protein n=1 Tax=Aphanomyces invadans TaxID=157072 RepID=A0A024U396_9STRA|nr:hypothetical protein H310_07396 [Aphanomyces invadans]ETW00876.1 hypothetical protein H310_07396 [Aphanomyces invadans]RHY27116.1 hypothetical protein DYB32_007037 [Aphanomyces invadans]|eukprot:XP_008871011.1 hypothetical protein H310_07396 [Aphanomyces invadans]